MRALVVTEPNEFSVEDVPKPVPGHDEVLARVRAVSICGTDAHLIRGDYPGFWPPGFPFTPGHEWAGEIVEVGPGAAALGWAAGDRVAGTSHDACGVCQKCVEGHYNLCENYGKEGLHRQYGHNYQGCYAEYVVHGVKAVFRLPDALDFSTGAVLDPASIALHTANRGGVRPGDTVVVFGPGPVGILAADAARARGAGRVIVVGRGARLELAASMGNEVIDYSIQDPVPAIIEHTAGLGADVILDCAGVPDTFRWAVPALRKGGRAALVGIPVEGVSLDLQALVLYEKELVGVRASAGEMRHVIPLVADGRIRAKDLVTHHFSLEEFADALTTFNERKDGAMKVIVEP
ncbi:MAG: alcohol dehydrogenase catalytic domain-containing protein [Acidimicrobiia bacterium]|nr:alcohol dehydrogenase catalytic domain-containing protein [Acidimicrobiia bacterium]